jgi:DNA-binding CsgD family transcriptional regulator
MNMAAKKKAKNNLDNRQHADLALEIAEDHPSHKELLAPELTDQQRSILRYKLRGMRQESIASVMNVSQPYISKQLKKIREFHLQRGTDINQSIVVGENVAFYEEIEREAWSLYYNKEHEDKLKALQTLLSARKDANKLLMDVGVLKRSPTEHVHEHTATPLIQKLREARQTKELVIDAIEVTHEELPEPEPPQLEANIEEES